MSLSFCPLKDKQHKGSGTQHQGANGLSSTPADSTLIKVRHSRYTSIILSAVDTST